MSTKDREEYVRSRWEWIVVRRCDDRPEWEWFGSLDWQRDPFLADSEQKAWSAAFSYTCERERRIQLIEEEIAWLTDGLPVIEHMPIAQRILAREQAALAELKKGMK